MNEEPREKTQTITIRVPNDTFNYIKQKAKLEERSINWIIAKMLQTKVDIEQNEDQSSETHA